MSDELAVQEPTEIVAFTPVAAAMQILGANKDFDVDKLGAILELQMKHEANEARKAYHAAMTAFKENPPKIFKDKKVSFGNTNYKHATLGNVTSIINSALSSHGLTAAWRQGQEDGQVGVTCVITHILGHSEETSLIAPADISGKKNPIQAIASTVSYLQRYTLLSITGLATDDMDDDGNGGPDKAEVFQEPVGNQKKAVDKAQDMLLDSVPEGKFLNYHKLCAFLVKRWGAYPANEEQGKNAALTIVAEKLINLVCEDK